MGIQASPRRLGPGPLVVGVACLAALFVYVEQSAADRVTHGFVSYYAAARLLVAGQFGPQVYNDDWFRPYIQQLTQTGVLEIFGPNPPTMALMAVPVAFMDHATARHVWLMASLACLAVAMLALMRYASSTRSSLPAVVVVAVLMLNPTVFANLRTGQAYIFVFALLTGVVLGLERLRDRLAGVFLGLALLLKSSGLALLVVVLARRRWRAIASVLLIEAAGVSIVALMTDPRIWTAYLSAIPEFVARPAASTTAYQTTVGLFRRLCVADATWNPSPAAECEAIARVAPAVLLAYALVITLVLAAQAPSRLWLAAGVCLSELTLPVAEEQHFISLAIPLVLLWAGSSSNAVLATAAALLLVPLDYTAHRFTSGWWVLLAYPRLYAAWLLWGAAVVEMYRSRGREGLATSPASPSG
jgi:hypothetical protein